jgi:hypothetical protein
MKKETDNEGGDKNVPKKRIAYQTLYSSGNKTVNYEKRHSAW